MSGAADIRASAPADAPALETLYAAAFPEEDLLPLVRALLAEEGGVTSLIAELDGAPAGHIALTTCDVTGAEARVALLGPLAVAPAHQRQGIGGALVRAGLDRAGAEGLAAVVLLGDPAYYGRFGFTHCETVAAPYPLPPQYAGAWQIARIDPGATPNGALAPPAPWRNPALWGP